MTYKNLIVALASFAVVAGCSSDELILPGERESLRGEETALVFANETRPIKLAAAVRNANWTHRIGSPSYRIANARLSAAPQRVWSNGIGQAAGARQRITTDPVVAEGLIYTMDSGARISATSTSGQTAWSVDLTPPRDESKEASGGGIAYGGGTLFVTNGFGLLVAMDPKTGKTLWQQELNAVGSGTPTYFDGLVYLVSGNDTAWAVDAKTGRVKWQSNGLPDVNNLQTPSAPAVTKRLAVFAFGSGELQGVFRKGGVRLWTDGISGERIGRAINLVSDISGDPVIVGKTVYAANHSGRLVAVNLDSGKRLWTAEEGSLSPVWPAGGSLFLVSDQNKLVRLDARDGTRIWAIDLPLFIHARPTRQAALHVHYGPILAGGQLRVASSDGLLRSYDPASGALLSTAEIPGGATSNPVVAGGTLYVVGAKGELHAFR